MIQWKIPPGPSVTRAGRVPGRVLAKLRLPHYLVLLLQTYRIMSGSLQTVSHPLVGATLSKLRRVETTPKEFREVGYLRG